MHQNRLRHPPLQELARGALSSQFFFHGFQCACEYPSAGARWTLPQYPAHRTCTLRARTQPHVTRSPERASVGSAMAHSMQHEHTCRPQAQPQPQPQSLLPPSPAAAATATATATEQQARQYQQRQQRRHSGSSSLNQTVTRPEPDIQYVYALALSDYGLPNKQQTYNHTTNYNL